ncbi:hypothetical protein U9M48_013509 [Paspalum notatum var. saurae]|uniref:Tf2-1-like SH3-like domain-containing protein n=1 Tax=Paspalum notatum var. saurae TaxID=547442 RepID=A0AAQ3T1X1_PASNO
MKCDVAEYVALCDICQRVKAEHQKPAGLLQPLKIPEFRSGSGRKLTDGQTERTNQILEDMLSACALQMPLYWDQPGEKQMFGPEIIEDAERQVQIVKENLRIAQTRQTRQKNYADHRRRDLEFAVGDYVYLKVSPIRGLRRFKLKGKLAPRYIGPFKIIDRKGEVACQLELPDRLSGVHDVFHLSQLKKCLRVSKEQLQVDDLNVQDDLTYTEYPVQILETADRVTRKRVIKCAKLNGVISRLKRLHGKEKMILEKIT